jgi:hypothetical protein
LGTRKGKCAGAPWALGSSDYELSGAARSIFLWLRADCRINNAIIGLQGSNTVPAHMPTNLWRRGQSGNPAGRPRGSRNALSEEVICALLRDFRQHGQKAVARVRQTQPAAYLKILALLVPREHKVQHSNPLKELTDEQLVAMVEYLETSLEAQAGGPVKVIEGMIEPTRVLATAPPVLDPPKRKPNRLMMEVDTAIGPQERKPRKRVPSPAST